MNSQFSENALSSTALNITAQKNVKKTNFYFVHACYHFIYVVPLVHDLSIFNTCFLFMTTIEIMIDTDGA